MTGPEHYAEAERLMSLAESTDWTTPEAPYRVPAMAAAQVHATLALTAAVALQVTATQPPHLTNAGSDWRAAISPAEATT